MVRDTITSSPGLILSKHCTPSMPSFAECIVVTFTHALRTSLGKGLVTLASKRPSACARDMRSGACTCTLGLCNITTWRSKWASWLSRSVARTPNSTTWRKGPRVRAPLATISATETVTGTEARQLLARLSTTLVCWRCTEARRLGEFTRNKSAATATSTPRTCPASGVVDTSTLTRTEWPSRTASDTLVTRSLKGAADSASGAGSREF
mmetsp:Transcript_10053/g.18931  ORF Transcript_10053/g.18931 Transcript_10053/m.18931 type:complete len:209 (+) Transcript_10053:451-1077(+)